MIWFCEPYLTQTKNRSNVLASILQNPELLEEVYQTAEGSAGSALKELETFKEGVEGAFNELQNTWEETWNNTLSSGFLVGLARFAEGFLNISSAASGLVPIMLTLLSIFTRIKYEGKTISFCPVWV